ncbi:MAG: bifunctional glutamate N-acetyltransferase/amino-acid acetyltransferase ArgJ [Candidatus Omnitrophica bacterium]|nr:bifunctional glutamate N-acetyltransferase/amino-acid acetyltransferase ArgJ [Candidatus Omnitrophota bacterium]
MKLVNGGVTAPKGYTANAAWCGIKRKNKDLCLIYSELPAKAAGVFTQNKIKAAPLVVSKKNLSDDTAQAIFANSGNANCMTGREGLHDANKIIRKIAEILSIPKKDVLIASTGVIGKRLPLPKIMGALEGLVFGLRRDGSRDVAKSLMTTDTRHKEVAVRFKMGKEAVTIGAVAKGAGMIHPNMATMLAFITTDADIEKGALKRALGESVTSSFNCITVDGDTSTNDTVFILANGLAKNRPISGNGPDYRAFQQTLAFVCGYLAEAIIKDAEGATKFVTVGIMGARTPEDAKKAGYAVATSLLVKTALYGEDPNWGRIAAAIGRSGAHFSESKLDICLGGINVLSNGRPRGVEKNVLRGIFRKRDIFISVDLHSGTQSARILTNDLSKGYIDINAHYTT